MKWSSLMEGWAVDRRRCGRATTIVVRVGVEKSKAAAQRGCQAGSVELKNIAASPGNVRESWTECVQFIPWIWLVPWNITVMLSRDQLCQEKWRMTIIQQPKGTGAWATNSLWDLFQSLKG